MDRIVARRSPAPVEATGRRSGVTGRWRIRYGHGHVADQIAAMEPCHGLAFQLFSLLYAKQSCRREICWAACPLNLDAHVAESSSQFNFRATPHQGPVWSSDSPWRRFCMCRFAAVLAPHFRSPATCSCSSGAYSGDQGAEIAGPNVFRASGQPTIAFGIIRSTNPPELASRQMAYVIVLDHPNDTESASTFWPTTLAPVHTISGSFAVGECTIALDHSIDNVVGEEHLHVNGQPLDISRVQ